MGSATLWGSVQREIAPPALIRPPQLLIVEPDRELRAALIELFARRGIIGLVLRDAPAAIRELTHCMAQDRLRFRRFDVVVCDVAAPGDFGLHLLAAARDRCWPVPVVLTASTIEPRQRGNLRGMGAAGLMRQPTSVAAWDRALRAIARWGRLRSGYGGDGPRLAHRWFAVGGPRS